MRQKDEERSARRGRGEVLARIQNLEDNSGIIDTRVTVLLRGCEDRLAEEVKAAYSGFLQTLDACRSGAEETTEVVAEDDHRLTKLTDLVSRAETALNDFLTRFQGFLRRSPVIAELLRIEQEYLAARGRLRTLLLPVTGQTQHDINRFDHQLTVYQRKWREETEALLTLDTVPEHLQEVLKDLDLLWRTIEADMHLPCQAADA